MTAMLCRTEALCCLRVVSCGDAQYEQPTLRCSPCRIHTPNNDEVRCCRNVPDKSCNSLPLQVECQFLEIHNDDIRDLLHPRAGAGSVRRPSAGLVLRYVHNHT